MMQPLTILLIVLLFLTGVIGGGVGLREFRLPWASAGVRSTALLASLLLGLGGVTVQQFKRVNVKVTNVLTQGALREEVILSVEGQPKRSIQNSVEQPTSEIEIPLPEAGTYSYSIEVFVVFAQNGQEVPVSGTGGGVINAVSDATFTVAGDYNVNPPTFFLQEEP